MMNITVTMMSKMKIVWMTLIGYDGKSEMIELKLL